jgi:hypothetical protein
MDSSQRQQRLAGYQELGYRIELPQTGASIWFGSETDEANNAGNNVCVIASVPMAALQSPKP